MHVPPLAVYPGSQEHALDVVLPAGEFEFGGQGVQAPTPSAALYVPTRQALQGPLPAPNLYFPAGHPVHVPPSGPVYPALQVHKLDPVLAAGESDSKGQAAHDAVPDDALYFPDGHAEHDPPLGPE